MVIERGPPVSLSDFIEVYPDALSAAACARLIERFEASADTTPGRVGAGVMPELKDSVDITLAGLPHWRDVEASLNGAAFAGLMRYLRSYHHALTAPLMLEIGDATGGRRRLPVLALRVVPQGRRLHHLDALTQ